MIKITLYNVIQDNTKSYPIFKPIKPNKSNKLNEAHELHKSHKCKIIFSSKKSVFFQFVLYVKYTNSIRLYQPNNSNTIEYQNFPYNGILYSCEITPQNPLIISFDPMDLCSRIIIQKQLLTQFSLMELNPIIWDKIFIINLARRSDRKKLMEEFFAKSNIQPNEYEFVCACDGTDPTILAQYNKIKLSNPTNPIITSGHFACLLSHLKVISLAKSRGYKSIMILEDDTNKTESDFVLKIRSIKVPEYDFIYLGGIMSKKKQFCTGWAYSNRTNIMGAYGYILKDNMYDVILNGLKNLDDYIDFFYLKHIQPKYKTICLEDIIKTDLASSDTSNKSRTLVKRLNWIK